MEKRGRLFAKEVLVGACGLLGRCAAQRTRVVILFYHSVDDSGSPLSVSVNGFREQLEYLKRQGFACCRLSQVVRYVKGEESLSRRSFCVTFDDGYAVSYRSLWLLVEQGLPFTVFVATANVGADSKSIVTCGARGLGPLLSWEQLKTLSRTGLVDIEAHGHTHRNLPELGAEELEKELIEPRSRILERIGREPRYMAYPRGLHDERVRGAVRRNGYEAACGMGPGAARPRDDRWALARIGLNDRVTSQQFRLVFSPGYDLYVWMRTALGSRGRRR